MGDIPSLAGSISPGQSVRGVIDYSQDEDWYAITVEKGKVYNVTLASIGDTGLSDPMLEVRDKALAIVAENDDNGINRDSALTFTADYNGTYYVNAIGGLGNTGRARAPSPSFDCHPPR